MSGHVHLVTDRTVKPVIVPPCRVPIAFKSKLKRRWQRREKLGVIQKVKDPSDWVSWLVTACSCYPNGDS
ncbi:hypothetical protein HOLleu_00590 [Holothuria leucospilota]|uniref:Uncharacterized protein n=1 Tax=Holothuria leucospilota TaxID=206669 RepID=A0A9Q1CPN8_HOLLE|nr:hypothetical protein HOLleu_00590 [Holothuria leucospilota]